MKVMIGTKELSEKDILDMYTFVRRIEAAVENGNDLTLFGVDYTPIEVHFVVDEPIDPNKLVEPSNPVA